MYRYGTRLEWVVFFIFIGWLHWPHANSIPEKFGFSSDRNDVLEWTDGFQPPMLRCPDEPSGSTLDESKWHHHQHIPRVCHLEIAKSILQNAASPSEYEHALFHQILSGRGVDYYLAYPFVRPEWYPFIQNDKNRISYNVAVSSVEAFASNVYNSQAGIGYRIGSLDSVYLSEETEEMTQRELVLPSIIVAIIFWCIKFSMDNWISIMKFFRLKINNWK